MSRRHEIRKQRGHNLGPGLNVDRLLGRALGMVAAKEVLREGLGSQGLEMNPEIAKGGAVHLPASH